MKQSATYSLRPNPDVAMPETAMVMAAGLGKRMRPLTVTRPKPLVEVAGKPLLDHTMDHLRDAGIKRAVVNVHYLADQVEAHLKARAGDIEVLISDERAQLMETGGGIVQARAMLGDKPFFTVNSDTLWVDGPIDALHALGFEVAVETNGTQRAPRGLDWICVSPKADAPLLLRGEHRPHRGR